MPTKLCVHVILMVLITSGTTRVENLTRTNNNAKFIYPFQLKLKL